MLLIFAIVDDSYVLHNQLQDQINEDLEMCGWVKECSSFTTASTWLYCLSTDTNILINWGWNIFCLFYILWDCWAHPPTQATQDLQCLKKFSTFLYILETFSSGDLKAESSWGAVQIAGEAAAIVYESAPGSEAESIAGVNVRWVSWILNNCLNLSVYKVLTSQPSCPHQMLPISLSVLRSPPQNVWHNIQCLPLLSA